MPSWDSTRGIWSPKRERAIDINTGEIYDGPDREAQKVLNERGVKTLGMDVTKDVENIKRARDLGQSVEEFLELNDEPSEETKAAEEAKKTAIETHRLPQKKEGVSPQGGVAPENVGKPGAENSGGFGSQS